MQIIQIWPHKDQLALPEPAATALLKHLLEPFQNEAEAQDYWQESQTRLVIFEQHEIQNINASLKLLDEVLQHQIERALESPEYTEALTDNYTIQLAILSDAGEGIYCITPMQAKYTRR